MRKGSPQGALLFAFAISHLAFDTWGCRVADAKPPTKTPGPFDVGTVRELVELMDKFDLGEVDLNDGDQRIRLRKNRFVAAAPAPVPAAAHAPPSANSQPVAPPPAAPTRKLLE